MSYRNLIQLEFSFVLQMLQTNLLRELLTRLQLSLILKLKVIQLTNQFLQDLDCCTLHRIQNYFAPKAIYSLQHPKLNQLRSSC